MHSKARARSPHSTAERVSRALGSAKVEVSCLHTRRQRVQAKRRRRTTSCVGLHPTGTWARCRATVPRDTPWAPQALQNGSSNPIGMRHSTMALVEVRSWPTRGQSQGVQPQERRQIRTGEGSLRHVEISQLSCVAAPITGELETPTHHNDAPTNPTPNTSIGSSYHTLKHEEPKILRS